MKFLYDRLRTHLENKCVGAVIILVTRMSGLAVVADAFSHSAALGDGASSLDTEAIHA